MPESIMPILTGLFLVFAGMLIGYFLWFRDRTQDEAIQLQLRRDNDDLRNSVNREKAKAQELEGSVATHQGKLHILQELCDDLVSGREQAHAERLELENEYSRVCNRLSDLQVDLERERRDRVDLEDALHSLKQEHHLAINDLESQWREQANRLETELASRQNDVEHLTISNERVTSELHETRSCVATLESDLEAQRSLLQTASQNVSGLEKEYISLESTLRNHNELLNESRAQAAAATSAKELAESVMEDLRHQLDDQKRQLAGMEQIRAAAETANLRVATLEQAIADRDTRVSALIEERDQLMQAQQSERKQQEKTRAMLEKAVAEREAQVAALIEQRERLQREQEELCVVRASEQARLENQESTIRKLRDNAEQFMARLKAEQEARIAVETRQGDSVVSLQAELQDCKRQIDSLTASHGELSEQLIELPHLRKQRDRMITQINTQKQTIQSTEQLRAELAAQNDALRTEINRLAAELDHQSSDFSDREREEIQTRIQHLVAQRDQAFTESMSLRSEIESLRNELAAMSRRLSEPESVSFKFHQATEYDKEYGGEMRIDPTLGRVYVEPPQFRDDLKLISGIAEVLERHLNEFGVYTYRQIMEWSPTAVQEFSERLPTFKDRIERDDWISQAGNLYRRNYRNAA